VEEQRVDAKIEQLYCLEVVGVHEKGSLLWTLLWSLWQACGETCSGSCGSFGGPCNGSCGETYAKSNN